MEAFDDAIRLRMIGGGAVALNTKKKHERSPEVGLELTTAVGHNAPGKTKP